MNSNRCLAITMWDFSWIERRWPGAGYENWDEALDGLAERGYNAVRIDAYPHLFAVDPEREWTILPCWNQQDWGSPAKNRIRLLPGLLTFLGKCRERSIAVGLSTWFQRDPEDIRMRVRTPQDHAEIWLAVLRAIKAEGLLDSLLFVDLCNEWPLNVWAPFFQPAGDRRWAAADSLTWIADALAHVRAEFPGLPLTFSSVQMPDVAESGNTGGVDFLEPHIWMAIANGTEFYKEVPYAFERFESIGYENLVERGESIYRNREEYWLGLLEAEIRGAATTAQALGLPLITTECWSIVDYKDWPLLDWGWVKEMNAFGVEVAASTGAWQAIATSNFCGPQFYGMWRDIAWHQRLTAMIRSAPIEISMTPSITI